MKASLKASLLEITMHAARHAGLLETVQMSHWAVCRFLVLHPVLYRSVGAIGIKNKLLLIIIIGNVFPF
jgi:hypothetical protein